MQVLKFARDLALENLHIEEVGCLGKLWVEPVCLRQPVPDQHELQNVWI